MEEDQGMADREDKKSAGSAGDGFDASEFVIPEVSDDVWRALMEASDVVKGAAPWKKLYDDNWFALKDRDRGVTHIGSVVGNARKVFGLHLYLHPEGVAFWNETVRAREPSIQTLQFRNRLLELEFVPKGRLQPEDWELRERLKLPNLPNKGRPYACFRATHPSCMPWFLEEEEARLLTLAAYACIAHVRSYPYESPDEPYPIGKYMPVIPTFALREGADPASGDEAWERTMEEMPLAKAVANAGTVDDATKERLKGVSPKPGQSWQIGAAYLPQLVGDRERPYFPRVTLVVDKGTELILGVEMNSPDIPWAEQFADALAEATKKTGYLPAQVELNEAAIVDSLMPLAEELDIRLALRSRLPAWESAGRALEQRFE